MLLTKMIKAFNIAQPRPRAQVGIEWKPAAYTSAWQDCRRNCECSCAAALRSWRTNGIGSLPNCHAQPLDAVGRDTPDGVLEPRAGDPGHENPLSIMDLLFGEFALLGCDDTKLQIRPPICFRAVSRTSRRHRRRNQHQCSGATRRISVQRNPPWVGTSARGVAATRLTTTGRCGAGAVRLVLAGDVCRGRDALGKRQRVEVRDGRVRLQVSLTPLVREGRLSDSGQE